MAEKKFSERDLKLAKICKDYCPICKKGREKGRGFLYQLVKLERHICPVCKAYEKCMEYQPTLSRVKNNSNRTKTHLKVKI